MDRGWTVQCNSSHQRKRIPSCKRISIFPYFVDDNYAKSLEPKIARWREREREGSPSLAFIGANAKDTEILLLLIMVGKFAESKIRNLEY